MKSLILAVSLFLVQVVYSQSPVSIDINPTNIVKGKLMLKDLAGNLEYVPLETKDNCQIGRVAHFDVSKNYILVYCGQTKTVFLFKRDGRFVSQISRPGQGSEEYLQLLGVFIDEGKQELILCSFNKHLIYNLSGKFLRKVGHTTMHTPLWIYFNNTFITGTPSGTLPNAFPVYRIWTLDMKPVAASVQSVPVEHKVEGGVIMTINPAICTYMHAGKPYVRESSLNDTVYVIAQNHISPAYILNTGKYGIKPEEKATFNLELLNKSVNIGSMAETQSYILFRYQYKKEYFCAYYSKVNGKLEYFNTKKDGIPNNYDNGLEFWPMKQVDSEWYCFLTHTI